MMPGEVEFFDRFSVVPTEQKKKEVFGPHWKTYTLLKDERRFDSALCRKGTIES